MSTSITYKGSTLTTVTDTTKILKTAGKYMEGDVIVTDTSPSIVLTEEHIQPGGGTGIDIKTLGTTPPTIVDTVDENGGTIRTITSDIEVNLQSKAATPSATAQTIVANSPYHGLSEVRIAAVGEPFVIPTGTISIDTNGTHTVAGYEYAAINIVPEGVSLQSKSATPTTSSQTITADTGYDGLSLVEIAAIPSQYIIPTGTLNITENGTKDVTSYAAVSVNVDGGVTINNQSKTISPSETQQIITYDSGYTGLEQVTVNAISSSYVGSGISRRTSTDLTASGAEISVPAGYYSEAASKSVATGSAGTPTATKGTVSNHSITVTPSVTNTTGYITGDTKTGTGVTVTAAELVSGSQTATTNDTYDVTNLASMIVNVTPTLQSKTASFTPTESAQTQTVTADNGYDGLNEVEISVGAISSTYVGSGITQRSSSDLTANGATVNVPAGYYSAAASKAVASMTLPSAAATTSSGTSKAAISRSTSAQYINIPVGYNATAQYYTISATPNGSVTAPASISGTAATVSTGTNTLTLTKTVSVTPNVTTAGYISSGTAGNAAVSLTASVTTKAAATYTPTTSDQTIAANQYLTGIQTIKGDSNLVGSNILSGKSIFGVSGSVSFVTYYTGSTDPASSLGSDGDIYFKVVS